MGDDGSGIVVTTDVDRAVRALAGGGLVGMPTETVYGLAADATDVDAVRRVFAVKERPADHPLILHLARGDDVVPWVREIPEPAARLSAACWPGPLTLLLRRSERVPDAVTGGRPTVAVRVPAHPVAAELLTRHGGPLVAPSANRFGGVSPTRPEHVLRDLGDLLDPERDVVLDGGPSTVGIESTIVDCTVVPVQVLRPGAITAEQVTALAGDVDAAGGLARAPGMLANHYAPTAEVRLVSSPAEAHDLATQLRADAISVAIVDVDDPVVYARTLYARLRAADDDGVDVVVAVLPADDGIGVAVRDRLQRASASGRQR